MEGFDFDYLVFEQGLKILNAKVEAWIKDAAKKAGKAVRLPLFAGAGLVATAWESSGGALPCCFWHELTGTKSINRTCVLVVFSWCAIGLGRYVRNCIFQFHYRSVYLAIIQGDPLSTKLTKENCKRDGMWNFHICALPFWTYSHMFLLANHRRSFFLTEGTAEHDLSDHLGWLKDRGPKIMHGWSWEQEHARTWG